MLTASSRGFAVARLFSVVRFLVSRQAQFVLSTLLVVHDLNWLLAMREPLAVARQPWVSSQHRQLADGPDLFSTVKILFGAVQVQPPARVRSQNVHRRVLRVALVAPTSRVRVQRTSSLMNHQQVCSSPAMEGLTRDDPLAGAPVFHDSFAEGEQASLTTEKRHRWALVLGELNSKKATPTVEVLNGLEKRDCHVPVGEGVFCLQRDPVGCLGSFVSVGGPEGRICRGAESKKIVWQAGWLVQVCPRIRALR